MCGIVGVVGNTNATDILIQGLEKLEYRGYDSAGIFVLGGTQNHLVNCLQRQKVSKGQQGLVIRAGRLMENLQRTMLIRTDLRRNALSWCTMG